MNDIRLKLNNTGNGMALYTEFVTKHGLDCWLRATVGEKPEPPLILNPSMLVCGGILVPFNSGGSVRRWLIDTVSNIKKQFTSIGVVVDDNIDLYSRSVLVELLGNLSMDTDYTNFASGTVIESEYSAVLESAGGVLVWSAL